MLADKSRKESTKVASLVANSMSAIWKDNSVITELLKKYNGKLAAIDQLPQFQRDGMKYYTQFENYNSTDIELCIKRDITRAHQIYDEYFKNEEGATFTLYLMWSFAIALRQVQGFNLRCIDGKWYEFENLPLFTTVAKNGQTSELDNIMIDNFSNLSWEEACHQYLQRRQTSAEKAEVTSYPYHEFAIATHITNINLKFTHYSIPTPKKGIEIERPMFTFGQRYEKSGVHKMPLHAKLPHASLYPMKFQEVLGVWNTVINDSANRNAFSGKYLQLSF